MRKFVAAVTGVFLVTAGGTAFAQPKPIPLSVGPHVEDPRKLPEPPPSVPDLTYDSRVLSSAASAEHFQGPLDGGWLVGTSEGDLYSLQLVDKRDHVEGAWRDLRRRRDPAGSGVLDQVLRTPTGLVMRFTPAGQTPVTLSLRPNLKGELKQGTKVTEIAMRKALGP